MEFSVTRYTLEEGVERLVVTGEVDLSTCEVLRAAIRAALNADGVSRIIVDLEKVEFLDSLGVRVLVAGLHLARKANVPYVVVNPADWVRRILDMTGVWTALSTGDLPENASPAERRLVRGMLKRPPL